MAKKAQNMYTSKLSHNVLMRLGNDKALNRSDLSFQEMTHEFFLLLKIIKRFDLINLKLSFS